MSDGTTAIMLQNASLFPSSNNRPRSAGAAIHQQRFGRRPSISRSNTGSAPDYQYSGGARLLLPSNSNNNNGAATSAGSSSSSSTSNASLKPQARPSSASVNKNGTIRSHSKPGPNMFNYSNMNGTFVSPSSSFMNRTKSSFLSTNYDRKQSIVLEESQNRTGPNQLQYQFTSLLNNHHNHHHQNKLWSRVDSSQELKETQGRPLLGPQPPFQPPEPSVEDVHDVEQPIEENISTDAADSAHEVEESDDKVHDQRQSAVSQEESNNTNAEDEGKLRVGENEIIIHVFDESNNVNRDFVCSREVLLREMKYFRAYLVDSCSSDDIDISVHCDVNIFQWLMDYIKDYSIADKMDNLWVISILISSYFLEMESLVEISLKYVHDNLQGIIKLPIELDCLNDDLIEAIARTFTIDELENIKDRKDKILGRLYSRKLESLLRLEDNYLCRCSCCSKIFTTSQQYWSVCHKAKVHFNFHGEAICLHEMDKKWNVHNYFINLRQTMSWREIYWKIWGITTSFHCVKCKQNFIATELEHCAYHKFSPVFEKNSNTGCYPCCNEKVLKFDTSGSVITRGCCCRLHTVSDSESNSVEYQTMMRRQQEILVPFHSVTGKLPQSNVLFSDEETKHFVQEAWDFDEDEDECEWSELEMFPTCKKYSIFDSDTMLSTNSNTSSSTDLTEITKKIKQQQSSATKKRFFNMDTQRIEDRRQLYDMAALLAKKRVDGEREKRLEKLKKAQKKKSTTKIELGGATASSTATSNNSNINGKKTAPVKRRSFR